MLLRVFHNKIQVWLEFRTGVKYQSVLKFSLNLTTRPINFLKLSSETFFINSLQRIEIFTKTPYLYVKLCYTVIVAFLEQNPQSSFRDFLLNGSRIKVQQSDGSDGAGGLALFFP